MILCNFAQNTTDWGEFRAKYFSASLAPAMMGVSPYVSRSQLLHMMATGDEQEFNSFQRKILDKGHEVEEKARPIACQIVGQELYRISACDDSEYLSASYDGCTMDQSIAWENKQPNKDKIASVQSGTVPECDFWQVVQQCAIGPKKCLYTVSDGTPENTHHIWYERNDDDVKRLINGWVMFEKELEEIKAQIAAGEYVAPVEKAVVGETQTNLPAVFVQVSGAIDIQDNFKVFGEALREFIDNQLITEPETDEDFATLELQIKTLKHAEETLDAAEAQALAQISSIDEMRRLKKAHYDMIRDNRLMAEKLVTAKKKEIRAKIISEAQQSLSKFVSAINETMEEVSIQVPNVDFAAAIKGKRTITTTREAAANATATAKLDVSELAEQYRANLKTYNDIAKDHKFLFSDLQKLIGNPKDAFQAMIQMRINEYEKAEEEKRAEAEKRKEEEAKKAEEAQSAPEEPQAAEPSANNKHEFVSSGSQKEDPGVATLRISNTSNKPSGSEIITVVAQHYKVQRSTAEQWLRDIVF